MRKRLGGKIINGQYVSYRESLPDDDEDQDLGNPLLDEIFTTRQFPGTRTNREFGAGHGTLASQFNGREDVLEAAAVGYKTVTGRNLNPNSVYYPQLGDGVFDPRAYIEPDDLRHNITKRVEEMGMSCTFDGSDINAHAAQQAPAPAIPLGTDLVDEEIVAKLDQDKDLAAKVKEKPQKLDDLRNEVIEKHGPQPKKSASSLKEAIRKVT